MNIFGYIIIVITVLLTIVVGIVRPPMHSRVMIYNSEYVIVDENKTPQEEVIETKELPTAAVENNLTREEQIFDENTSNIITVPEVKKVEQPKTTTQTKQNKVSTQTKPATTKQTSTTQKPKTTQTTTQKPTVTNKTQQTQKQTQQKPVTQPQTTTQTVPKTTYTPPVQTVKVLTEQEELIAWNRWHSNLQNQIIRDSKLPVVPMGTVFKMSFNVDRSGRVSNVQTWSTNPQYTPYAIEYIAPVIRGYQGKSILDFPAGSARTTNKFEGAFKIAQTSTYSTPNDYNDVEKVKR